MMNDKNETKRRYYEVGLQLEKLLFSGFFKAGDQLPTERELSAQYQTSRATIREALIMLELKGLIEVRKGAGIFFKDASEIVSDLVVHSPSVLDIGPFELLQARNVLETSIVEFAAKNIRLDELHKLRDIIRLQEESFDDCAKFEALDREFHLCIAESTQNRMLIDVANRMWNVVRTDNALWKELNKQYLHNPPLKMSWLSEHKKILAALQKRAPEAAKLAMLEHLEHSKKELTSLVDFGDQDLLIQDDMYFIDD